MSAFVTTIKKENEMKAKSVYEAAVEAAQAGKRVRVYLRERYLVIEDEPVVEAGKTELEQFLSDEMLENFVGSIPPLVCVLDTVEELYGKYKHSIPTEKTESQRRPYFKALAEGELSDDDMLYGERRDVAQARLEAYILCAVLDGSLTWDEEFMGKWFWQSEQDKDLVLLRSWID